MLTPYISAIATLLVCLLNNFFNRRRDEQIRHDEKEEWLSKQDKTVALIEFKIGQLTEEVREHNNFAHKIPILENDLKNLSSRVETLERKVK